ncbi:putative heparinase superfamily protein [Sphingomonas leidyi]|uniref:Putative heparinase superfamily protein n=1 Tax=Sphingomonas leidyi TaxID=68569 RepID=A0A7X5UWT3_9SPHN|nr:heparinase II/III family protein [Sphingomonas leidyi]NIJ63648.1 putative heparinase superfamily protein [Sphingomonas leidyi]
MHSTGEVLRYWNTLRHLKPIQILGRARFRFKPSIGEMARAPARRVSMGAWQAPIERPISLLGERHFLLLGVEYRLPDSGGWDDEAVDKLRRYNLHYFDDLAAPPARNGAAWHGAWIARWIAENPPRTGTGWEPYPTSLRIVNWIKWALAGNAVPECFDHSLALQARWLSRRLEWHLLGNHLFANAKALLLAGLFFIGDEADEWRRTALRILGREFPEQLLSDGGHFELSPMYHAIFVEDVLDMVNAAEHWKGALTAEVVKPWREALPAMLNFLRGMTHPDGEIGFFNDAAIGIAPSYSMIAAYAARLGIAAPPPSREGVQSFSASGYARVSAGPATALLDLARVGPDYLPGHAHADTLSFELSLGGRRLIVNGGTSEYGAGPVRHFERSTAAHNTVAVDGEDSSEVWSGFRVARRAYPVDLQIASGPLLEVRCAHDGYRRLPGKVMHYRCWTFTPAGLTVEDRVSGKHGNAVARFLLVPDAEIAAIGSDGFEIRLDGERVVTVHVARGRSSIAEGWYSPRFGERLPTRCIEIMLDSGSSRVEFEWH